jgi:hypothetical protein
MTVHLSKGLQTHRRRGRVVTPSANTSKSKVWSVWDALRLGLLTTRLEQEVH